MKLFILSITVATLSLASCGGGKRVTISESEMRTTALAVENSSSRRSAHQKCVNLNTATAEELASLRGIGEVIAKRVIDYRERHGPFRRREEIIIIEGFSEKKYLEIAGSICLD
jgi:competence ComEA-like helix-hairpin-helix protein